METPNKSENIAAALIAAPFVAIFVAKRFISNRLKIKDVKPIESKVEATASTTIPKSIPQFVIADRTHCQYFGVLKVSFFQYSKSRTIRIIGNKNGIRKELHFTPEIATKSGVIYCMESAINWVREVGFKSDISQVQKTAVAVTPSKSVESVSPPLIERVVSPEVEVVSSSKSKPFTGTILSMGEVTRPGKDNKPPYQIFSIKLKAQYGGVEKEFSGEHLSELAEKLSLSKGTLVKVHLLGRYPFDVVVNGVTESRTRNEFSVIVL